MSEEQRNFMNPDEIDVVVRHKTVMTEKLHLPVLTSEIKLAAFL